MAKKDNSPKMTVAAGAPSINRDDERKWKAEDALRTLTRAEEHKGDKDLMRDVAKMRDEKMKELAKVKIEVSAPAKGGKK